jgi:hypothetical protein
MRAVLSAIARHLDWWTPNATPLGRVFLLLFLASTPLSVLAVYGLGGERRSWALINGYGFAIGYSGVVLAPLLLPRRAASGAAPTLSTRLDAAVRAWIVVPSCFTQITFQPLHSLLPGWLSTHRGSVAEWPFFSYGLSDARWDSYDAPGAYSTPGLAREVLLINMNDAALGFLVLLAYACERRAARAAAETRGARRATGAAPAAGPTVLLVLCVVFRDATLLRETVEYMLEHHWNGYPHTVDDPALRPHALAVLWLVNWMWLVLPLLSPVWGWQQLHALVRGGVTKRG